MKTQIILFLCSLILGLIMAAQSFANGFDQNCSRIQIIDAESEDGKKIEMVIESYFKNKNNLSVRILKFRTIERLSNWAVAEVEIDLEEPGIFVLEKNKNEYRVASVFGGAVLENPTDFIRQYFKKELPDAPKALFDCFKPKGAPFI